MKYLRRFDEGKEIFLPFSQQELDELKDLCEARLIYLLDEGFRLKVREVHNSNTSIDNYVAIGIGKGLGAFGDGTFTWFDVKDFVIPLVEQILNKYLFVNIKLYSLPEEKVVKVEDIIQDKIDDNCVLWGGIVFEIAKYGKM